MLEKCKDLLDQRNSTGKVAAIEENAFVAAHEPALEPTLFKLAASPELGEGAHAFGALTGVSQYLQGKFCEGCPHKFGCLRKPDGKDPTPCVIWDDAARKAEFMAERKRIAAEMTAAGRPTTALPLVKPTDKMREAFKARKARPKKGEKKAGDKAGDTDKAAVGMDADDYSMLVDLEDPDWMSKSGADALGEISAPAVDADVAGALLGSRGERASKAADGLASAVPALFTPPPSKRPASASPDPAASASSADSGSGGRSISPVYLDDIVVESSPLPALYVPPPTRPKPVVAKPKPSSAPAVAPPAEPPATCDACTTDDESAPVAADPVISAPGAVASWRSASELCLALAVVGLAFAVQQGALSLLPSSVADSARGGPHAVTL